jgi:hypothetical protein
MVSVLFHECSDEVAEYIRTKCTLVCPAAFPGMDIRIPVPLIRDSFIATFSTGPHTIFIETRLHHGFGFQPEVIDLPFPGGAGVVAGTLQDPGEAGIHTGVEPCSVSPAWDIKMIDPSVRMWILPGQQSHPARGTLWHGPGIVKKHPFPGHVINIEGQDRGGTITADPFLSKVIDEDENDIRLLLAYSTSWRCYPQQQQDDNRIQSIDYQRLICIIWIHG